ncbi:MAG: HD domain-containing protein [Proteobacteria bacterium]|nr:HD domain-containing protein [Pseudomonadota bacterium]
MSLVLEFLEFVEQEAPHSVRDLLGRILLKCRKLTGAEAGTAYLVRRKGRERQLVIVQRQNDTVKLRARNEAIPLNAASIAGFVAGTGEPALIADAYRTPEDRPYGFDKKFETPNYRTRSILCLPIKNFQDRVIAVIELVNRRAPGKATPVAFSREQVAKLVPVARVLSGYIERTDNLEQIAAQNVKLRQRNRLLAEQRARVAELHEETEDAFKLSISLLARAAEIYDEGTGNHIVRVNEFSRFLAERLGMPKDFCEQIHYSAQLHDVGKMVVDTSVLKKGGKLSAADRDEMNKHPVYGYKILSHSHRLKLAAEIALFHHEKWDGTGYPHGVKGEEIPTSARIVALADAYDALRAVRPYKAGFSHEKAVKIIVQGDERIDPTGHFDPQLVQVFSRNHRGMAKIWQKFTD